MFEIFAQAYNSLVVWLSEILGPTWLTPPYSTLLVFLLAAFLAVSSSLITKALVDVEKMARHMKEITEWMKQRGIRGVWLAPETTGKTSQVGDLDEVIKMCREVDLCKPTIDWAHLYARYRGHFVTSVDDVVKVIDKLEKELGTYAVKPLHTHFTRVEFGEGGEREHHTMAETQYGPDFEVVCQAYKELGVNAVVISESPLLDKDALVMKHVCCGRYCYC